MLGLVCILFASGLDSLLELLELVGTPWLVVRGGSLLGLFWVRALGCGVGSGRHDYVLSGVAEGFEEMGMIVMKRIGVS